MSSSSNEEHAGSSVFANILKPGSSLHPTFLAVLDGAFALLFLVFVALAFLTAGNIHIFVLMGIELALWASVKWVVNELKATGQGQQSQDSAQEGKKDL
ncbi:hypothetical protein H0H92_004865 [Tricholoma furcatifolium]|nr:hypothetical protein H0H92_004865 [Tricholoma furcatifolium]